MNKQLLKQFIIIIGALFLVSCKFEYKKPVYHDPYDARHNQLLGDVHNVREVEYAAKMEAKQLVEGEVMSSKNYLFNLDGKILSRMDTTFIPQNETSFQEYSYSRIGKLRKRTTKTRSSDRTLVYKPEFDYKGDAFFVLYRENSTYRDTVGDSKSTSKATFTFSNEGLLKEREVSTNGKKVIETKYEYDNESKSGIVGDVLYKNDISSAKSVGEWKLTSRPDTVCVTYAETLTMEVPGHDPVVIEHPAGEREQTALVPGFIAEAGGWHPSGTPPLIAVVLLAGLGGVAAGSWTIRRLV